MGNSVGELLNILKNKKTKKKLYKTFQLLFDDKLDDISEKDEEEQQIMNYMFNDLKILIVKIDQKFRL